MAAREHLENMVLIGETDDGMVFEKGLARLIVTRERWEQEGWPTELVVTVEIAK